MGRRVLIFSAVAAIALVALTRAAGGLSPLLQAVGLSSDGKTVAQVVSSAPAPTATGIVAHIASMPAGGGGGGVAQTQVRGAGNVWTDVGYAGGDLNLPVQSTQLPAALDGTGGMKVHEQGTVTVQAPAAGALCLDATLTGGTAKSIVRGGAK